MVFVKASLPPTLPALVKLFHGGMFAKVQFDDDLPKLFLTGKVFGIHFSYVFKAMYTNLNVGACVFLLSQNEDKSLAYHNFEF